MTEHSIYIPDFLLITSWLRLHFHILYFVRTQSGYGYTRSG